MKWLWILCSAVFLLYLAGGLMLVLNQRYLLYFPTPPIDHGLPTEFFEHAGERISVIVVNSGRASPGHASPDRKRVMLYFGGNGESVAQPALQFQSLDMDASFYFVNYRGYGRSTGTPSEGALFEDARFIYESLAARHGDVAVMGRSLGSGVAVMLASEYNPSHLILVSPYDSIVNVAAARFPIYPINGLIQDRYDSIARASEISAPTIVIMAETDRVVPRGHSLALFDALSPERLSSATLDGSNHNTISRHPRYLAIVRNHLEKF
ncbi:MAG: pimeloyl-ACP methyl ester carboxylesterase [Candidatus Azotimanducaceae bacterium]|jgi:pimeloyl-ACP methyl ester carboxylesterase